MTQQELSQKFYDLYDNMANSKNPDNMKMFGCVMCEMMEWMIANKADAASEWIERLESIKWHNFLTQKEAERIAQAMVPKALWSHEQWKIAMAQHEFATESQPAYNSYALWITMNMIMSDSADTISKYVNEEDIFCLVHDLAVDKLTDEDGVFSIRRYFNL